MAARAPTVANDTSVRIAVIRACIASPLGNAVRYIAQPMKAEIALCNLSQNEARFFVSQNVNWMANDDCGSLDVVDDVSHFAVPVLSLLTLMTLQNDHSTVKL